MAKRKAVSAAVSSVVAKGSAMTDSERVLAKADIKASQDFEKGRGNLIDGFVTAGRVIEDIDKPEEGGCDKFYTDMNALSFDAMGARTSTKGRPKGSKPYNVAAMLELSGDAVPQWAKDACTDLPSGVSIRKYWQQQRGAWKHSVKRSWANRIKAEKALFASPDERTRDGLTIIVESLETNIKRLQKLDTPKFNVGGAVGRIEKLVAFISE